MINRRVEKGVARGREFEIEVDGEKLRAHEGETIAAVMLAAGRRTFRQTGLRQQARGYYCGIGLCHECMMVVNGVPNTRTCQTLATPGCRVETQEGPGKLEVAF
ncbi:MAG: (2Fe-2S)-binding protein [Desulfobacterales bacterium]|nr:MAG: (2Fe-2S)-binding protein [Desulfobacterales bacterium]